MLSRHQQREMHTRDKRRLPAAGTYDFMRLGSQANSVIEGQDCVGVGRGGKKVKREVECTDAVTPNELLSLN